MDCLFCKIINKEIPNHTVFEDENVLAFLDIHPCSKGHTVVIPKKHFANIESIDRENWALLSAGLKSACARVQAVINPPAMNVGLNNNPDAGQAVAHIHWHIIPRYKNDGGGSMHSIIRSEPKEKVEEIAKLFRQ